MNNNNINNILQLSTSLSDGYQVLKLRFFIESMQQSNDPNNIQLLELINRNVDQLNKLIEILPDVI